MIFFYILVSTAAFSAPPILSRFLPETAFKVLGVPCLAYAGLQLLSRRPVVGFFRPLQARLFLLLYLMALFSCLTGGRFKEFRVYTDFALFLFVTVCLLDSLGRLRWVLLSAVAGIVYGSVHVVLEWVEFRHVYSGYRPGASVGDSNFFATSAVLCLPFAFLMVLHGKERWERLFYGGCLGISLLGVTACASRGGFLALAAAMLFLVLRSPRRARNLILISMVWLPLALFLPVSPLQRLLHPTRSDEESKQARLVAWQAGTRMIANHPLMGVGLGNFRILMPQYEDPRTKNQNIAHNSYLEVAAELGLPALAVFLGIPFFSYRSLERVLKRERRPGREFPYYAALGLQAGLVGFMVGGFFLSGEYSKLFWLVITLSMCLPYLRPRNESQALECHPHAGGGFGRASV
jgi:probable O-glycosylation ligase (exosortase A-associated)